MNDLYLFFTEHEGISLLIVGLFSLIVGSFLNVVIYRLPRIMQNEWANECRHYLGLPPQTETERLNLAIPFSHCPSCKSAIMPWHNIPLFSYWWLRGQCANCHASISLRYPIVEAMTAITSVYVCWHFGFSYQTVFFLLFTWIAIALTFIDLDHHLLPDQLTLLLLWLGLLASIGSVYCSSANAIIGAVVGYLIFALTQIIFGFMTGKTGMGQGDYKFLAAIGAFVGWQLLPFVILFASCVGLMFALLYMLIRQQYKSVPLPFGPYLALAGWLAIAFRPEILSIYAKLA